MSLPMSAYLLATMLIAAGLFGVSADYWIISGVAVIGSLFFGQVVMNDGLEQSFETATEFIAFTTAIFIGLRLIRIFASRRAAQE